MSLKKFQKSLKKFLKSFEKIYALSAATKLRRPALCAFVI